MVLVVEHLDPEPDLGRIERLLTLAWRSGATPVVVLTKADLVPDAQVLAAHGRPVVTLTITDAVDDVLAALQRDKKRTSEGVGFVALSEPGEPRTGQLIDPGRVRAAVEELLP